jgi:hypothetical protein
MTSATSEKCFVIPDPIGDPSYPHRENGLARPLLPSYVCGQSRGNDRMIVPNRIIRGPLKAVQDAYGGDSSKYPHG